MSIHDRAHLVETGLRAVVAAADHCLDLAFYAQYAEDPEDRADTLRQVCDPGFLNDVRAKLAVLELRLVARRAAQP